MKKTVQDLAIFGGRPAFEEKLHVGRPNTGNRETLLKAVTQILDRRWLSNNGPFVQELERSLQEMLGVKHCIPICNGTVALEIAIRALGLSGEVIVPSFTFIATAHALQWQEITPVFCDISSETHNIDPDKVEAMITPRTKGIIGVHLWGRPCDAARLQAIADRHNLQLMFDASHALGCSSGGRMIGNFGRAEVFSFHATKFVNTFEGGAIATNDDDLAAKIRLMKNFGFAGFDNVVYVGTNGKMSEISAAMGLTCLESMTEIVDINRRNYRAYAEELQQLRGVSVIEYDQSERQNYQYIILEIDPEEAGVERDVLLHVLQAENVVARRYFYPGCHRMEPYRSLFPHAGLLLPETERLCQRALALPNGTAVGEKEIRTITGIIGLAIKEAGLIRHSLRREAADASMMKVANL